MIKKIYQKIIAKKIAIMKEKKNQKDFINNKEKMAEALTELTKIYDVTSNSGKPLLSKKDFMELPIDELEETWTEILNDLEKKVK